MTKEKRIEDLKQQMKGIKHDLEGKKNPFTTKEMKEQWQEIENLRKEMRDLQKDQPTDELLRAERFQKNLEHVKTLSVRFIYNIIEGKEVVAEVKEGTVYIRQTKRTGGKETVEEYSVDRKTFIDTLRSLHLTEWKAQYSPSEYGLTVLDGFSWTLEIDFSNETQPFIVTGDNMLPYNSHTLAKLLKM